MDFVLTQSYRVVFEDLLLIYDVLRYYQQNKPKGKATKVISEALYEIVKVEQIEKDSLLVDGRYDSLVRHAKPYTLSQIIFEFLRGIVIKFSVEELSQFPLWKSKVQAAFLTPTATGALYEMYHGIYLSCVRPNRIYSLLQGFTPFLAAATITNFSHIELMFRRFFAVMTNAPMKPSSSDLVSDDVVVELDDVVNLDPAPEAAPEDNPSSESGPYTQEYSRFQVEMERSVSLSTGSPVARSDNRKRTSSELSERDSKAAAVPTTRKPSSFQSSNATSAATASDSDRKRMSSLISRSNSGQGRGHNRSDLRSPLQRAGSSRLLHSADPLINYKTPPSSPRPKTSPLSFTSTLSRVVVTAISHPFLAVSLKMICDPELADRNWVYAAYHIVSKNQFLCLYSGIRTALLLSLIPVSPIYMCGLTESLVYSRILGYGGLILPAFAGNDSILVTIQKIFVSKGLLGLSLYGVLSGSQILPGFLSYCVARGLLWACLGSTRLREHQLQQRKAILDYYFFSGFPKST